MKENSMSILVRELKMFWRSRKYLEDAKVWYNKAKEDPEVFTEPTKRKRAEFEEKLGSTGSAVARKEKQVKQLLKELWQEMREIFQEKKS